MKLSGLMERNSGLDLADGGVVKGDLAQERKEEHGHASAAHVDEKLKIKAKESLHILIQLRAMLVAGVPLLACLRSLIEHAQTPKIAKALQKITRMVEEGHDLSYAFACLPRCYENYVVHLVAAGERAGALDDSLQRCIELLDKQIKLGGKIKGALAYPGFLIILCTVMTVGILVALVPKFEKLLMSRPDQLPGTTKLVLASSSFLRNSPGTAIAIAIALVIGIIVIFKVKTVRKVAFDLASRLPGVGGLIHKAYISRSVNALAMTLESGVPILTGLEHARQISQLPKLQNVWEGASAKVRDGLPMYAALEDADLPPALLQMIIAGESSGSLDSSLRKAGEFLDRETTAALELFTGLLGPATVVLAGALVGFIVISLMTPILQLARFV
ncbi:MAG: type II secretion system F family protein [Planctomycetota bacterium]|nr:MAG: type II secretion system F family protein [Planctomycetota bacterium]